MATNNYAFERVWQIHKMLRPKPEDLVSPNRFFVREGKMMFRHEKKKKKKKRNFFLFNDILLLCRKEGPKRYYLRIYITLRAQNVSVQETNIDFQILLKTRQSSFIFFAQSEQDRKDWITDIQHSISGTHNEELIQRGIVPEPQIQKTTYNESSYDKNIVKEITKDIVKDNIDKKEKIKPKDDKDSSNESSSSSENDDDSSSDSPPPKPKSTKTGKKKKK